VYSTTTNLICI